MSDRKRTTRTLPASVATVLCAALLTTGAMAAPPKLQTIDVTPAAKTILVGQTQAFTATGTFSDGSKQALGPAISNIALGGVDTCALLSSGGVECWGAGSLLGDGSRNDSLIPRPVKRIYTAVAVGYSHSHGCAVLRGGAVQCWGSNSSGELGDGTYNLRRYPVTVIGISTAAALSLNADNTCALLASGTIQCWGSNLHGQLGIGTSGGESPAPVSVIGISTATAISIGREYACALLQGGSVQCWGDNEFGQLGDGGTEIWSFTPVTVRGIGNATAVAAGDASTCALLASGAVQCWGLGLLGNGTDEGSHIPVPVTGISTAIAITGGGNYRDHFCAILRSGSVKCWGRNDFGQLGNGTTTDSNIPVTVLGINAPTKLVTAVADTCALFSGGMMRCWGLNNYGQLGNRQKTDSSLPVTVVGTPGVLWKSSNATKATITDRGVATGRAKGSTTITATTAGFINDNAVLTVK